MSNKKTMKKSMVITTVVMVLLLIAALSTATFAWYTSNTNVTVSQTDIYAANSADANLEFVWKSGTNYVYNGTSIAFTGGTANAILPMVPTEKPVVDTTEALSFVGATVNAAGTVFTDASSAQTPWTQKYTSVAEATTYTVTASEPANWSTHYTQYYTKSGEVYNKLQADSVAPTWVADTYYSMSATTEDPYGVADGVTVTELYIANRATSGDSGNLAITATISNGTNSNLASALRIAIFFQSADDSKVLYKGTLTATADAAINYSAASTGWVENANVADAIVNTGYTGTTSVTIGKITAGMEGKLVIYAWFDGSMLGNTNAGKSAGFELTVAKAA